LRCGTQRGLQDDPFIPRTKTEQEFARLTKAVISRSAQRRPDKIKFKLLKTGPWRSYLLVRGVSLLESAMTAIVPREDESNPAPRRLWPAIAAACALLATSSASFAYDGPTFRSGLWKFERTLETDGKPNDRLQTSGLPIARQMIRCVNPTLELKAEFTPLKAGGCSTRDLRKTDDGYAFQKVCGGAAPIKTEINVKGDSGYTEIHQGSIGKIPTKETVVAQRVGDCDPPT
jgi:hypothetical protein